MANEKVVTKLECSNWENKKDVSLIYTSTFKQLEEEGNLKSVVRKGSNSKKRKNQSLLICTRGFLLRISNTIYNYKSNLRGG